MTSPPIVFSTVLAKALKTREFLGIPPEHEFQTLDLLGCFLASPSKTLKVRFNLPDPDVFLASPPIIQ
jgi:hypothetical protein